MGLLSLMKNLPLSYNRDLQEDKEFIFESMDYSNDSLLILSLLIKGMKANAKKMEEDCKLGQITATDLDLIFIHKISNVEIQEEGKTTTTSSVMFPFSSSL